MKSHWVYVVSLMLVVMLGRPVGAQPEGLEGYQIVRITVSDAAQLEILERLASKWPGFEIWSDGIGLGVIDARVSPEQKPALDASGLKYVVDIADLQAHYDELFRAPPGGDFFEAYRSYDEHVAFLSALVADYPDLAEMVDLGPSVEGRRLWAIRITGPGEDKPAVMYHGGQHGNEIMGPPVISYIARHLLNNYDGDPEIKALVDGVEWFLLPIMNPDGYEHGSRFNADGWDLNRDWGGPANSEGPFTQPETAAMRDFFLEHTSTRAHIDLHSSGEIILWPWGHTRDYCEDQDTFYLVGGEMRERIRTVRRTYYRRGPIYRMLYRVRGGSVDYSYAVHQIWAYAFELNTSKRPPTSEIIPTSEEITEAILYLTSWIYDCNENGIPDIREIRDGEVRDCNGNGTPDGCEGREQPDCNDNGEWDACDILDGTSEDCDDNAVPDECDPFVDCNSNGVFDACDIREGTSDDCNLNGTPDECDPFVDCNHNDIFDPCDIQEGTSDDCNANWTPDDCDIEEGTSQDCNSNAIPDECDIAEGRSEDCDDSGTPDECDSLDDCNKNDVQDICELRGNDCNANEIPDECDIASGTSEDCDENGTPDECDPLIDCNDNGVFDACDIRDGTSKDCDESGVPDECEEITPDPLDGYALSFERNSARVIVSNFDGFPTGAITVSQWLRTSDTAREAGIFSYAVPAEDDEFLILDARNLSLRVDGVAVRTGISLTDGRWHHIALTWASATGDYRFYLDGSLRSGGVLSPGHVLRPGGTVVLADDQDSVGGGFRGTQSLWGTIDELRVWNLIRSEEEIRADMRRRLGGDEPGLVGYWRFDEGEGATAEDLAGDNDGEVIRSVWIETFDEFCACVRDPEWRCDGDVDGDGQVNPVDSGLVQASFGSVDSQDLCNYDVDCNGQINPVDAGIVQSLFGTCETPRGVCP